MARKHSHYFNAVINGSMGADITSPTSHVGQCDKATYHCVWTGSPVGEIIVEVNLSPDDENKWYQIDTGQIVVNGAGSKEIILSLCHERIRLKYVRTSGTGTLNVELRSLSIGA